MLEPAIYYARTRASHAAARLRIPSPGQAEFFSKEWPTSAATWLPGGEAPKADALFTQPGAGRHLRAHLQEAEAAGGDREKQIEAARAAF